MRRMRGFTLAEVAVALVILAVISTVAYRMLSRTQSTYQAQRDLVEMQQNARMAMETITSDIRQISFRKDPTQGSVIYAGIDSIVFVADLFDTIPGAEEVSVFLSPALDSGTANPNDRVITRIVRDTSGAEVLTGPVAYGIADSGLSFFYFDREGDPMSFPIVQAEHISEVEIAVTAQTAHAQQAVGYQEVTMTSIVYPRNLPFTPPMPRPNPPGCGTLTSPNCESLTIDWTTPTQNTDGSDLTFNDISYFTVYYGTNPDSMRMDTRLARNMNEWTVRDLVGGTGYFISVTVTSVAGVESFPCTRSGTVGSSAVPRAPSNLVASGGSGAVGLTWSAVTEDTTGTAITAEVTYTVYRDVMAGFVPGAGNQIAADLADTSYTDFIVDSCATYYYRVKAEACGMQGAASTEASISLPARPSCPPNVYAQEGSNPGEILASWEIPVTRIDGSPLTQGEISGYRVYYSLNSGVYTDSTDVVGGGTTAQILSNLLSCSTYYVNVAAIDACTSRGVLCGGKEAAARTSAPCNEYIPQAPAWLSLVPGDERMDLTWGANQVDCDLDGYRIYYGTVPGVYNGTEALEGLSPVYVSAAVAHVDTATAQFSLTGLPACTAFYISVTCVDVCVPPHESSYAPEQSDITMCGTCDLVKECVTEIAEGSAEERVRFQVGSEGSTDLTVQEIEVAWGSGSSLGEILAGGTSVWNMDGSSGEGPAGAQSSPALLDVTDYLVVAGEDFANPKEMTLVFDGTATGDVIDVTFNTDEGECTVTLSPCGVLFEDDFTQPNGSPNGWTPRTGSTWTVSSNQLKTSSNGRITPDALGFSYGDYTVDTRVKVKGRRRGRRGGIYVRYNDTGNYYLLRFYPASNKLELLKKVNYGGLTRLARTYQFAINTGQYYDLVIAAYGSTFRVWFDDQLVDWDGSTGTVVTDTSIPTGNISMYAWKISNAYFDDVRVEPTCGCGGVIP